MIEAELADGRVLEFPDGTDPAVIQAKVKELTAPTHSKLGVAVTGATQGVADVVGLPDTAGRLFLALSDKMNPGAKDFRARMRANPTNAQGTGNRFAYAREAIDKQPEFSETPSIQQRAEDLLFNYIHNNSFTS